MIVDSSAVVAILQQEDDHARWQEALLSADSPVMSAGTYVECGVVLDRRGQARNLDRYLGRTGVRILDLTVGQAQIARTAYREFGRGSGHPAKLNYGDCFSYALAIDRDEPLLFKGDDFVHTDVRVALPEVTDQ